MLSKTLKKFGYPKTLVKEYKNWLILCRGGQITLGCLILICKDQTNAFSKISSKSFKELEKIIQETELKLKNLFAYDKINYLMFMMHDPEVHFHIIPRYASNKKFAGEIFKDIGWPKTPDWPKANDIKKETFEKLIKKLKSEFKK